MLPLLDRELPARRIDLFQPAVNAGHPLAAIEMTNDSGSGLPPGVLTLYQQNPDSGALYLGDARLASLPAGDNRLLSYALDGKVTIDRDTAERRPIVKASVADGVMRIGRVLRWTTTYRVKSAGPPPPALLIEQKRRPGAVLTSPDPKNVELTPQAYRIPANLPADGDGSLTVVEEQPIEETIRLLDIDENRLGVLAVLGRTRSENAAGPGRTRGAPAGGRAAESRTRPAPGAARPADRGRKPAARQSGGCRQRAGTAQTASSKNSPRPRARSREFPPRSPRHRRRSPRPNATSPPMSIR